MPIEILNIPDASRTLVGLSDIGYTFESAVADLIDNSITQGEAENIFIIYDNNEQGLYLRIFDDGIGMSRDKLFDAMKIGSSSEDYQRGDLSKYGLGMKTASLSQCNAFTVLSKSHISDETSFTWDKKVVENKGWTILEYDKAETIERRNLEIERISQLIGELELFDSSSWTLICWDDVERHNTEYNLKKTTQAKENYIARKLDVLKIYLRTVFHRFLAGEDQTRYVNIFLNGEQLRPFDPFCRSEKNCTTDVFYDNKEYFKFDEDNVSPIKITRYILPTKEGELRFSSPRAWKEAAGYLSWNDAQGYYVYRNNRLIDFGGWFGTKSKDEHDKLARVSIDLDDSHDNFFKLDVKKSSIQFPEVFKNYLTDYVNKDYLKRAKLRYKKGEIQQPIVTNRLRTNIEKVNKLSEDLVKYNNIHVFEKHTDTGTHIQVSNPNGGFSEKELVYRQLDPKLKITHSDFGNDEIFWKMVPGPGNYFQVLLNERHPFYEKIYVKAAENKIATSSVDALLYSLAFIELRFKTEDNRSLFLEINEVASDILIRVIEKNLL